MKINYEILIDTVYQKALVDMSNSEPFDVIKNQAVADVFEQEIKAAFYATSLKFGGHNNNLFNRYSLKKLEKNSSYDAKSMFNEIKEKVMFALNFIVDSIYNGVKEEQSYNTIKANTLTVAEKFMTFKVSKYCSVCGQNSYYQMSNGSISETSKNCPFPKGIEPFTIYMPVRSNRLVFANHFEDIFNTAPLEFRDHIAQYNREYNSINSELGAMYEQQHQLNHNLLQVLVSDAGSVIVQNPVSGVIMAVNNDAWNNPKGYKFPIPTDDFTVLGKVDSNAHIMQVIDSCYVEEYAKQHGISFEEFLERYEAFTVPVTPGTYSVKNYNAHNYDNIKPVFFSLKKI